MVESILIESIIYFAKKLRRFTFISVILWIVAYALPDIVDTPNIDNIDDSLIESVFFAGKKANVISYEELQRKNETNDKTSFESGIENYYSSYINQAIQQEKIYDQENLKDEINFPNLYKFKKPEDNNDNFKLNNNFHKIKEKVSNENVAFSKNLYTLYGNKTIFNMNLNDLDNMVSNAVMNDGQAVILWETLLQMKTDRAKILYGKENNELDTEIYVFNFFALKASGLILVTLLIFLLTHKIQICAIKNFFIFNLISILLTYYMLENLYHWKYYIASSIMFVQFAFCIKYMFDSMIYIYGLNKDDYDIFVNVTKTKTLHQFILKLTISIITNLIVGYFALNKFKYFMNYVLFYLCLIQTVYLVAFYIQYEVHPVFQPFKHFVLILTGFLNFLITNFHKNISRFSIGNTTKINIADSFYLVSETFSFICISYLYEYLFTQANGISQFFYERNSENEEFSQKISMVAKNYKEHQKNFKFNEDCLWLIIFFISVFTSIVGISKGKYLIFVFSMQYFKIIIKVFGALFKIKITRCLFSVIIFFLIIGNHIIGNKNDNFLFDFIEISNNTTITFIKFIVRFIGLVFIILMIIANFEFIAVLDKNEYDIDDATQQILKKLEVSTTIDKKKKKKVKTIEISIVNEDRSKISYLNILYANFDLGFNYMSIILIFFILKDLEKNYFVILFYSILLAILLIRVNIF